MILKGVPDIITFNRLTQTTNQLKARLQTTSQEAVTGRYADIAGATGGRIGEASLVKKGLDDIDNRKALYGIVSARIDTMTNALDNISTAIGDLGYRALSGIESPDDTILRTVAVEAETTLQSVFSMLNVSHGNRNLFAGAATQDKPLGSADQMLAEVRTIMAASSDPATIEAALDTYFNDPAGGFMTGIYQGGTQDASSIVLGTGSRVDYSVRADDQAIRDTLRGLAVLANTDALTMERPGATFKEFMTAEVGSFDTGLTGLLDLQATLGVSQQAVTRAGDADGVERTVLSAVYQTLVGRDQYEAAAELTQLETQLEASYLLTSRISNLKLVNFLR